MVHPHILVVQSKTILVKTALLAATTLTDCGQAPLSIMERSAHHIQQHHTQFSIWIQFQHRHVDIAAWVGSFMVGLLKRQQP